MSHQLMDIGCTKGHMLFFDKQYFLLASRKVIVELAPIHFYLALLSCLRCFLPPSLIAKCYF